MMHRNGNGVVLAVIAVLLAAHLVLQLHTAKAGVPPDRDTMTVRNLVIVDEQDRVRILMQAGSIAMFDTNGKPQIGMQAKPDDAIIILTTPLVAGRSQNVMLTAAEGAAGIVFTDRQGNPHGWMVDPNGKFVSHKTE